MKSTQTLRVLIVVELALAGVYFYLSGALKGELPLLLQPYLKSTAALSPQWSDNWPIVAGIGILVLNVLALLGLWFRQSWAHGLYLISTPALLVICFFLGPKVDHAIAYTVDILSVFVMGLIVSHIVNKS